MHQVLRLAVVVGFVISALPYQVGTAQDYHVCGNHSTGWHSHAGDTYYWPCWKIISWDDDVFWSRTEKTVFDGSEGLFQRIQHTNDSCSESTLAFSREVGFEHVVEIDWGAEISAEVEGAARLWFRDVQATVGARVNWNISGKDTNYEKFSVHQSKQVMPCRYIEFFYEVRKVHKEFTSKYARAEFHCRDHHANRDSDSYLCDVKDIKAFGRGYISQRTGFENETKICDCTPEGIVINTVAFNGNGEPIID